MDVTGTSKSNAPEAERRKGSLSWRGKFQSWLPLLVIAAATLIAYSPILFNFFAGDDFVHLTWLKDAIRYPELILRNFHSSWLDGTTTKFYRPLISVFMVSDYLQWGTNGLGFHITNLVFHLFSSCFLYLIMKELLAGKSAEKGPLWPLAAASLFALYPLHPEAVSWITGRVDSVVTTFCLASIWFYMKWRNAPSRSNVEQAPDATSDAGKDLTAVSETNATAGQAQRLNAAPLIASLACFILGLLSKEMAITVPAVLVAYELTLKFNIKQVCLRTLPFWAVVVAYFGVRRWALGTFVGGYDDSLLFIADPRAFVLNWLHALRMMLVPLNKEIFGAHHILTKTWEVLLGTSFLLGALSFCRNKQLRLPIFFLGAWLLLCLVPVYKIFAISDDLQGSRLAYLATAPLCCLLALGLSTALSRRASMSLIVAASLLSGILLWSNNQPWRRAGLEANAIRHALATIYQSTQSDPQTLLIGLPDHVQGAYVCRNALWGMMKKPQFAQDISNCLMVNGFEPVQPFGFLKQSLVDNRSQVRIFRWDEASSSFEPLRLPAVSELTAPVALQIEPGIQDATTNNRPSTIINCGSLPGWQIDFVQIDIDVQSPGQTSVGADLLFSNNIHPAFELGNRTHAAMQAGKGKQSLLFALRSLPDWAFGTSRGRLELLLPPNCQAKIISAQALPPSTLLPRINFANSGYLGTKGYLHLSRSQPRQTIFADASGIARAVSTALEVTRVNLMFEEQNCRRFSKVARIVYQAPLKGQISLNVKDFPAPGIYEARLWAKDKAGNVVGLASDHIVIPKEQ